MILYDLLRHYWGLFEFGNAPTQWCNCPPFLGCLSRPSQTTGHVFSMQAAEGKDVVQIGLVIQHSHGMSVFIELVNLPIKTAHGS